jgi:uncharacterized membrane protein YfhO
VFTEACDSKEAAPSFSYRPGRVQIITTAEHPCHLVISELDYPGWTARVDGNAVPLERFDNAFLSAPVAAGRHETIFLYRPWSFFIGLIISGLTCLLAMLHLRRHLLQS